MRQVASLYDLTAEYDALLNLALGEMDDDGAIPRSIADQLAAIEGDIQSKIESCCYVVANLEAAQSAAKAEADRLRARAAMHEAAVERLKGAMQQAMQAVGIQKVKAPRFSVSICKNSQPSIEITSIEALPANYFITKPPEPSKTLIREAIKTGATVPGVEVNYGCHLRIS